MKKKTTPPAPIVPAHRMKRAEKAIIDLSFCLDLLERLTSGELNQELASEVNSFSGAMSAMVGQLLDDFNEIQNQIERAQEGPTQ